MDKIWYRNPLKSEVIGRCGGDEKRMTKQNRQKSNAKKTHTKTYHKIPSKPRLRHITWDSIQVYDL